MCLHRSIAVALISPILLLSVTTVGNPNPPSQYQLGYKAGAAYGKKIGIMDGSGESGTNAMHTNATCSIEKPKNKFFDRGYVAGCRTAYEKTFEQSYNQRKKK
jgi:hypothetical protein